MTGVKNRTYRRWCTYREFIRRLRITIHGDGSSPSDRFIADRNLVAAELRLRDIKKAVHQITEVMVMSVEVRAPMPGKILEVLVKVGDQVKEDDEVIMLEAMKMENPIYAPADGTVKEIKVKANDSVETEQVMMVIG
jgi:acetyl-CoA carboxylase biotin carboxyl carrier protein